MSIAGTPDWQRGIVTAGKLLGTIPSTGSSLSVNVPPNTETLVMAYKIAASAGPPTVVGNTTSLQYPITLTSLLVGSDVYTMAYSPVSPAIDSAVTVTFDISAGNPVYIMSDQGIHQTVDLVLASLVTAKDAEFVDALPVLPCWDGTNSHPILTTTTGKPIVMGPDSAVYWSTAGVILAAPGAGYALYLFGAECASGSTGGTGWALSTTSLGTFATLTLNSTGAGDSVHIDLGGMKITEAITATEQFSANGATLRYALEVA